MTRVKRALLLSLIGLGLAACGSSGGNDALKSLVQRIQKASIDKKFPDGAYINKVIVTPGETTEEQSAFLLRAFGVNARVDADFINDVQSSYAESVTQQASPKGRPLTLYMNISFQNRRNHRQYNVVYYTSDHYVLAMIGHDERTGEIAFETYKTLKGARSIDGEDVWAAAADFLNGYGLAFAAPPGAISASMRPRDFPGEVRLENTGARRAIENLRTTGSQFGSPEKRDRNAPREDRRVVVANRDALRVAEATLARAENRQPPAEVRGALWLSSFHSRNAALFHLGYLQGQHAGVFGRYAGDVRQTGLSDADHAWAVVIGGVPAGEANRVCAAIADNETTCGANPS